jgi:superfamily II DNA or RNA helicase
VPFVQADPSARNRAIPVLRDYQKRDVAAIRERFAAGARRVLYQAPTGSGKTVLFSYIVAGAAARGNRVAILGHRQEIVEQISTALDELAVPHGLIAAGHAETPDAPVQVAGIATLVRRLDRLGELDLLVADEGHHSVAGTWRKIINAAPDARILGVTATPERLDGKGLRDIFDTLVVGPTASELIEQGYLSRFATFAPAQSVNLSRVQTRGGDYAVEQLAGIMSGGMIIDGTVDEYARLCAGAPAIVFCVDIHHSQLVATAFARRGYRAAHVDGDTPANERRRLIAALGTGEIQVLCNCGLISEGLDVPMVAAVVLLRPTQSLALYLQQVGRALRPAPDKARALVLDHAGNTYRFGPADAPRDWSLDGRPKARDMPPPVRRCPECGALNLLAAWRCTECGKALRHPRREVPAARLVEANRLAAMNYRQVLRWAGRDEARLRRVAQARGYKPGWIWHRLQESAE